MVQAERWQVRFPMRLLEPFNLPNPFSRTMAPGVESASNRNECQKSSWGPALEAYKLTAICETNV
jgi:hypothetical protein